MPVELVPALIALCSEHPDPSARRQLAGLLVGLVGRPSAAQRGLVAAAAAALVRRIGAQRAALELLPHVAGQVSHPLVERRQLAAEVAAAIAPLLGPQGVPALAGLVGALLADPDPQVPAGLGLGAVSASLQSCPPARTCVPQAC